MAVENYHLSGKGQHPWINMIPEDILKSLQLYCKDYSTEKDFSPKPKNPKIAMVFREIGLADELGSGMIKLLKYTKAYSNGIPKLIEGDIFKTEIPLAGVYDTSMTIPNTTLTTLTKTQLEILELIKENNKITRKEMAERIGITKDGIQYNLNVLKEKNILKELAVLIMGIGNCYKICN